MESVLLLHGCFVVCLGDCEGDWARSKHSLLFCDFPKKRGVSTAELCVANVVASLVAKHWCVANFVASLVAKHGCVANLVASFVAKHGLTKRAFCSFRRCSDWQTLCR